MAEQMIEANGVELCTETFGDAAHPPLLLIMGTGASMLWWEEGFCQLLADGGRFVVRYDHRDTGRSVTYDLQRPGYSGADLVADAAGVLDAFDIPSAHLVGVSAGAAFAQLLALDRPDRVLSLVLISTSPALPGKRELPPPTDAFGRFVSTAAVDWSDAESVIDYLVDYSRVLAGERRPLHEASTRQLVRRDVERARDLPPYRTTTCSRRARCQAPPCPRSRRQPWSSTAPPTRCSRGSTAKRWRKRSQERGCSCWRMPGTAFIVPTGNGSPLPSSNTLPRAVRRSPDGALGGVG